MHAKIEILLMHYSCLYVYIHVKIQCRLLKQLNESAIKIKIIMKPLTGIEYLCKMIWKIKKTFCTSQNVLEYFYKLLLAKSDL